MTTIKEYSGVIALIVLAIMGVSGALKSSAHLAGSTSCASITCLAGGLRLVSDLGGTFESDVAATFATTLGVTGLTSLATLDTTGRIAVASTTPSSMGNVVISSTGTTTLMLGSSGTGGTCFQVLNSAGTLTRMYVRGTTQVIEAGSCK